eukprot:403339751
MKNQKNGILGSKHQSLTSSGKNSIRDQKLLRNDKQSMNSSIKSNSKYQHNSGNGTHSKQKQSFGEIQVSNDEIVQFEEKMKIKQQDCFTPQKYQNDMTFDHATASQGSSPLRYTNQQNLLETPDIITNHMLHQDYQSFNPSPMNNNVNLQESNSKIDEVQANRQTQLKFAYNKQEAIEQHKDQHIAAKQLKRQLFSDQKHSDKQSQQSNQSSERKSLKQNDSMNNYSKNSSKMLMTDQTDDIIKIADRIVYGFNNDKHDNFADQSLTQSNLLQSSASGFRQQLTQNDSKLRIEDLQTQNTFDNTLRSQTQIQHLVDSQNIELMATQSMKMKSQTQTQSLSTEMYQQLKSNKASSRNDSNNQPSSVFVGGISQTTKQSERQSPRNLRDGIRGELLRSSTPVRLRNHQIVASRTAKKQQQLQKKIFQEKTENVLINLQENKEISNAQNIVNNLKVIFYEHSQFVEGGTMGSTIQPINSNLMTLYNFHQFLKRYGFIYDAPKSHEFEMIFCNLSNKQTKKASFAQFSSVLSKMSMKIYASQYDQSQIEQIEPVDFLLKIIDDYLFSTTQENQLQEDQSQRPQSQIDNHSQFQNQAVVQPQSPIENDFERYKSEFYNTSVHKIFQTKHMSTLQKIFDQYTKASKRGVKILPLSMILEDEADILQKVKFIVKWLKEHARNKLAGQHANREDRRLKFTNERLQTRPQMTSKKKNQGGRGGNKQADKKPADQKQKMPSSRVVKEVKEVEGGLYDDDGFYILPDGDFYDPDGYYFNKEGFDEFGGSYDGIFYIPGEKNKHEFEDLYGDDDYDDELIRQFEQGADDDDDGFDEEQERLYREFKKKENILPIDEEEDDYAVDGGKGDRRNNYNHGGYRNHQQQQHYHNQMPYQQQNNFHQQQQQMMFQNPIMQQQFPGQQFMTWEQQQQFAVQQQFAQQQLFGQQQFQQPVIAGMTQQFNQMSLQSTSFVPQKKAQPKVEDQVQTQVTADNQQTVVKAENNTAVVVEQIKDQKTEKPQLKKEEEELKSYEVQQQNHNNRSNQNSNQRGGATGNNSRGGKVRGKGNIQNNNNQEHSQPSSSKIDEIKKSQPKKQTVDINSESIKQQPEQQKPQDGWGNFKISF